LGSKIIADGVDICKPIPCHSENLPRIIIESYEDSVKRTDSILVTWNVLNLPSGAAITSNQLKWSDKPSDILNVVNASGSGPYEASFTAPSKDGVVYFLIKMVIDQITFSSILFSVVVSGASTSTTTRTTILEAIDRI